MDWKVYIRLNYRFHVVGGSFASGYRTLSAASLPFDRGFTEYPFVRLVRTFSINEN